MAIAEALRPGGVLAIDLCDLEWGRVRTDEPARGWVGEDWALVTRFSTPAPDRYVREMAMFTRNDDGSWRRDDERHDNVLIDTSRVPALLAEHGVDATVRAVVRRRGTFGGTAGDRREQAREAGRGATRS